MLNPHLDDFVHNTQAAKQTIINDLLGDIQQALTDCDPEQTAWKHGLSASYFPLVSGEFGLKLRLIHSWNRDEIPLTADIYHPDLPMTPFLVPIRVGSPSAIVYVVQDFPVSAQLVSDPEKVTPYLSLIAQRGYDTSCAEICFSDSEDGPKLVDIEPRNFSCAYLDHLDSTLYERLRETETQILSHTINRSRWNSDPYIPALFRPKEFFLEG